MYFSNNLRTPELLTIVFFCRYFSLFSENRNEEIEEGNKWNRAKIVKKVSFTIQTRNLNITRIYAQRHMHSLVVIYNARTQRIQKV